MDDAATQLQAIQRAQLDEAMPTSSEGYLYMDVGYGLSLKIACLC